MAFASEALGKGVVIMPSDGNLVSPASGTITTMFPSMHAVGISTDYGAEILIHIGIDTVQLDGRYFKAHIRQGDRVSVGQKLVTFDKAAIENEGYETQTMVVVTNSDDYKEISILSNGTAKIGDELLEMTV